MDIISPQLPKLAVLIPSSDIWQADFGMSVAACVSNSMRVARIGIINEKSSMITAARNNLVVRALSHEADYVFFVDSDMFFPADSIARLMAHDKDIVGCTYNKRVPPYETLGVQKAKDIPTPQSGLVEMENLPGGFVLIKTSVFRNLKWPYYYETYENDGKGKCVITSEDYNFCKKAEKAGYKIWCDVDLTFDIGHIGQQTNTVASAQAHNAANG